MKTLLSVTVLLLCVTAAPVAAVVGGGDITLKAGKAGDVLFSHDSHVDAKGIGCRKCHPVPYLDTKQHKPVSMKEMQKGKSCGACHDGKNAFSVKGDCAICHKK